MENYSTWTIIAFTDIDFETVGGRGSDKINYTHQHTHPHTPHPTPHTHTHTPTHHTHTHIYIISLKCFNLCFYSIFKDKTIIFRKQRLHM
jgi:hypothetical protein